MSLSKNHDRFADMCASLGLLTLLAACSNPGDEYSPETQVVDLIPQLKIQGQEGEYQFYRISDVLVTESGVIWVTDGLSGNRAMVRQYGPTGEFIQQVGGVGDGPGEYREPVGIAAMKDGRIAVRDGTTRGGGRVILYDETGALDATWTTSSIGVPHLTAGTSIGPEAISVDSSGIVWLPVRGRPSIENLTGPPTTRFLRVSPSGVLVDSLVAPQAHTWPTALFSPESGVYYEPPYQPKSIWGWSPSGTFATARTDEYRIVILPPPEVGSTSKLPVEILRQVPPVTISSAERAHLMEQRRIALSQIDQVPTDFPEEAARKPPIRAVQFSDDDRLMVLVSLPSVHVGNTWKEPSAYDVFDRSGRLLGRIVLPEGFYLVGLRGDLMWGVAVDNLGVESVAVYRLEWQ